MTILQILTDRKCSFMTTLGKHASRDSIISNKDPFRVITKYFRCFFFKVEPRAHILYNKCEVKECVAQSDLLQQGEVGQ